MRIFVKAKPYAREEKIERIDEANFVVSVKERPIKGEANRAITKALAEYFKVPVLSVKMFSGFSSRDKIFDIKIEN